MTPAEFSAMFSAEWPRVCAYVARRTQAAGVEDVAAEVFAIAWRRRDALPRDPVPWLLRTAANVLRDQRRGELRRGALPFRLEPLGAPYAPAAADVSAEHEQAASVLAALARLRADERELIMLIHWDGLSAVQAARVLGCSHVAARTRLMRARRRLATLAQPPLPEAATTRYAGGMR